MEEQLAIPGLVDTIFVSDLPSWRVEDSHRGDTSTQRSISVELAAWYAGAKLGLFEPHHEFRLLLPRFAHSQVLIIASSHAFLLCACSPAHIIVRAVQSKLELASNLLRHRSTQDHSDLGDRKCNQTYVLPSYTGLTSASHVIE